MIAPWLNARETCTWACHVEAHNSDLGDDFAWSVGTPIPAPFNGTVTNQIRQESPVLYITRITSDANPSVQVEFMHLSKFAPAGHYKAGQTIGWSGGKVGAVGSGHATGPHLHVNAVVAGKLTPIRNILSEFASVGTTTVIGDDMTTYELAIEKGDTTGAVWFSVNRIQRWHVPNATSLTDYIAFIAANGGATYDPKALPQVATIASFGAIVIDGTTASGGAGATVAQVQQISDASDAKVTAAIAKIPAAPTKFVASQ